MLETLMKDTQFAARLMRRSPGFTAVVLLTLTVGIGANTVMFSVVNTVLLRPLPYRNAAALTLVRPINGINRTPAFAAGPDFYRYRAQNRSFEYFDAFYSRNSNLTGGAEAERVPVLIVSSGFFVNLGIQPAIGRGIFADDVGVDARRGRLHVFRARPDVSKCRIQRQPDGHQRHRR